MKWVLEIHTFWMEHNVMCVQKVLYCWCWWRIKVIRDLAVASDRIPEIIGVRKRSDFNFCIWLCTRRPLLLKLIVSRPIFESYLPQPVTSQHEYFQPNVMGKSSLYQSWFSLVSKCDYHYSYYACNMKRMCNKSKFSLQEKWKPYVAGWLIISLCNLHVVWLFA